MKLRYWIVLLAILYTAYYLISPAFVVVEVDDTSPLEIETPEINPLIEMDPIVRAQFDAQMAEMKDIVKEMDDQMPTGPSVTLQADFVANKHDVSGRALVIESENQRILRFEDFETINGPNLHIYLSKDLAASDFVDLGKIKATKGNVNYKVDDSINLEEYNNVLVWCVPFKVLFSHAELGAT